AEDLFDRRGAGRERQPPAARREAARSAGQARLRPPRHRAQASGHPGRAGGGVVAGIAARLVDAGLERDRQPAPLGARDRWPSAQPAAKDEIVLAVAHAREAVRLEPYREAGYGRLVRMLAANGDRAEAVRAYQQCRERLEKGLGVAPSAETERLYRELAG